MEKYVFHITEKQFNGLVELGIFSQEQRGDEVELQTGTYLEFWMTSKDVHTAMRAIDALLYSDQKVFDQGEIAETYLNVAYAWHQYETAMGFE